MNTQTVTINLVPGLSTPPVVNVKQGDIGRPIAFRVMDGTGLMTAIAGATAKIEGTKPSGLGFSVTGTISGNMVTLDTTEAMTQEAGRIPAEISFTKTGLVLGTANFILAVERDPHPENVTDGTYETMDDIQAQVNAIDTRVTALEAGGGGSGLTDDVKTALLQIAQKVAYIDAHGQDYYDDLYDALYSSSSRSVLLVLSHVSSSNTQSTVEAGDSYTTTLTASTNYTINSVTVLMGGVDVTSTTYSSGTVSIPSVTGNIVITATAVLAAQSITAVYTQSGTVYDTDTLDSLKPDLVVTANYSGGTSETVPASDYTLSGTLTVGTSTITVTYAGLTDTFSVTVTSGRRLPTGYTGVSYIQTEGDAYIDTGLKEVPDGITGFWGEFAANVASTNTKSLFGYQGIASGQVSTYRLLVLITTDNELKYYGAASGLSNAISGWDASAVNDVTVSLTDNTTYPVFTVNNTTTTGNKQKTTTSNSGVGTIYLLAQNYKAGGADTSDTTVDGSYVRCYGFKMFGANDALLRDYVPCVRTADSAVGLYDFITETFYPSIGQNAFTSGV